MSIAHKYFREVEEGSAFLMTESTINLHTTKGTTLKTTIPQHLASALGINDGVRVEWIPYENGVILRKWNEVDDEDVILSTVNKPHQNTPSVRTAIPKRRVSTLLELQDKDSFIWTIMVYEGEAVLFAVKK